MGLTAKLLKDEKFFQSTWAYIRQKSRGQRIEAAPIFLVGCGHSGTSVLLRLLGAHSRIYGVPYESRVFTHPDLKLWLTEKIWNRNTIANRKHRWMEKTPKHVRSLERIFNKYPEARVLFAVRDGRDVAVSIRKRVGDFESGLQRWVDDNLQGLAWKDDPRVMLVRYEDLVKRYDEIMPGICAFLDEPFEEGLIDYHEKPAYLYADEVKNPGSGSGKDHKQYRNWQINQRLFDGSGKWIGEMTDEEKRRFKADADAVRLLAEFGYSSGDDW